MLQKIYPLSFYLLISLFLSSKAYASESIFLEPEPVAGDFPGSLNEEEIKELDGLELFGPSFDKFLEDEVAELGGRVVGGPLFRRIKK